MPYQLFANLVLLLHLAFVLFVLLGGLFALRWRWMPWLHLPAATWGTAVELLGMPCPLTPLENQLRRAAGDAGYTGGFIDHYLLPLLYPVELTPEVQWLLAGVVVAFNLIVYLVIRRYWMRGRSNPKPSSSQPRKL
ncbi:MAG: DUF2784 domain-containing protein [Candidatus Thiodiazotropha sp.]